MVMVSNLLQSVGVQKNSSHECHNPFVCDFTQYTNILFNSVCKIGSLPGINMSL